MIATFKALQQADTFLDFQGKEVLCFKVNGVQIIDGESYRDHELRLPGAILKTDGFLNKVEVCFSNEYRNDSVGLHRFLDPEDGK